MTLKISWSALRTHEECRQQGYLRRSGKRAKLQDTRVFFPGTVTDRVVRDWLADDPYSNPGAMPDMVSAVMEREKELIADEGGVMVYRDKADKAQIEKDCIEAVTKIEPALVEKVLPFDYQPDFGFKVPLQMAHPDGGMDTVILNGFMDILVHDPETNTWRVYDVKHTRDDSYYRKTQGQLGFYDLVVMCAFGAEAGTSEVGLLQPLCKERVKLVPLSSNSRTDLMSRVARMADEVWREDREPRKDNTLCGYCSVRHACTKFQPVVVNGKKRLSF